jgi:hypothetical protein
MVVDALLFRRGERAVQVVREQLADAGMIELGDAVLAAVPYQHTSLAWRRLDGSVAMTHVVPPARIVQLLENASGQRTTPTAPAHPGPTWRLP